VTIVSYKTHKWRQLYSVLKGQTSYWSQDTLWHLARARVCNNPEIGNNTQETVRRYGCEDLKSVSTATRGRGEEETNENRWGSESEDENTQTNRNTGTEGQRMETRLRAKKERGLRFCRWGFKSWVDGWVVPDVSNARSFETSGTTHPTTQRHVLEVVNPRKSIS